jgi:hypothetical protein
MRHEWATSVLDPKQTLAMRQQATMNYSEE